ncbi:MAG: hypothetical protein LBE10_01390 [Treponema sp.]|jgi:hypothetical protein|nr:hypothetical protein [Treponema sp.]
MTATKGWLPTIREGILVIADDWFSVCAGKKADWNIPDSPMTDFVTLKGTAAALETAKNETTRTPVAAIQCKEAFDTLIAIMRDLKRKSFYTKQKKDMIEFGPGNSGKTAYFVVQIENEGKERLLGLLVNAFIPNSGNKVSVRKEISMER